MSANITLTGRMAGDPELRFTPSGVAMAKFSVATSRRKFNKDTNAWEDVNTTFWPVTCWQQLAEEAAERLSKGQAVIVSGEAYTNSWENRDGEKRSRIEVRADAAGPDLRWAKPAQRGGGQQQQSGDDPWASAVPGAPDEPPF